MIISLLSALLVFSQSAIAEDVNTMCGKVGELAAAENYPKAIEELSWIEKDLQKKHQTKLGTLIPEKLGEYQGAPVQAQSALGISSIERKYTKPGGKTIKFSIGGGTSGAGANGFAALGRMAAAFGGTQPGMDSFRINGLTANLNAPANGRRAEVTVFLQSGSILKLETTNSKNPAEDGEELKKLVQEQVPIAALDEYLQGKAGSQS